MGSWGWRNHGDDSSKPVPVHPQVPLALFHEAFFLLFQVFDFLLLLFFLGGNVKNVVPRLAFHGLPDEEDIAEEKEPCQGYNSQNRKEMFHGLIIKEKGWHRKTQAAKVFLTIRKSDSIITHL